MLNARSLVAAIGVVSVVSSAASALTVVLDFKEAAQGTTQTSFGGTIHRTGAFDAAAYGFTTPAQYSTLTNSILNQVITDYRSIPTKATLAASPIPAGFELDIDFVIGNIGAAPSNGDSEYYYFQIGSDFNNSGGGSLGVAFTNSIRTAAGADGSALVGYTVGSIFTDQIRGLSGLSPSNALSSGNLLASTYAIGGTTSHEIGHTLSLGHIYKAGSVQPSGAAGAGGLSPLMGTGALDLPNQDRISPREFSLSGFAGAGGTSPTFHVAQLVSAVGLRAVPEPTSMAAIAFVGVAVLRRVRRPVAHA